MKQEAIPTMKKYSFSKSFEDFGALHIRPFDIAKDSELLYEWVQEDYAFFWGMQGYTLEEVVAEYKRLLVPKHYKIFVGEYHNEVVFVLEQYCPQLDSLFKYYPAMATDSGIHIIVAPPKRQIKNFTWYIFATIMEFVFHKQNVSRIVIEPDIRNKKMFALCERIGFRLGKVIELPNKTAQLAFLTRAQFQKQQQQSQITKRKAMNTLDNPVSPQQAVSHLEPEVWDQVNALLIRKAICEFSHELLLEPEVIEVLNDGWSLYRLATKKDTIIYEFRAKLLALNHLWVATTSIEKTKDGVGQDLDAISFIKEFQTALGITGDKMPVYLEEIISTLYGSAFKIKKGNPTASELVAADFQTIEQSMTEGHPGFVANNGRIGFDSSDYRSYAPEAGNSFNILWLAGHKSQTVYAATEVLAYHKLVEQELDVETRAAFVKEIEAKGFDPDEYFLIPTHPWQWFNKLSTIFSSEVAKGNLICLGYSPDQYVAQQSIRTLFNSSNPKKFYVKTALSILNMGFMRGLPLYYLGTAPKMAVWLEALLYPDALIQETGFRMLGEIASVSYVNPHFEQFGIHNDYNKMLASLWRESPIAAIKKEQNVMTMAAFLHIDHFGDAFLPKLIEASGISIADWLSKYFKAYLSPLLHCFYKYDLVFMPHGENIIVTLENHIPVSILLKDITEEACILNPNVVLPDHLKRMYTPVPEDVKLLSVFTDIFDGFFRFMAAVLEEHIGFSEKMFWSLVASCIAQYQERYPEYTQKFEQYDLFAPVFKLSCLNRLQLNNHKQMIDLDDPVALLQFAGELKNPIAAFKPQRAVHA